MRKQIPKWSEDLITPVDGARTTSHLHRIWRRYVAWFHTRAVQLPATASYRGFEPSGRLAGIAASGRGTRAPRAGRASHLVSDTWTWVWARRPSLIGSCQPIELLDLLDQELWTLLHREVLTAWSVSSEVVVARRP